MKQVDPGPKQEPKARADSIGATSLRLEIFDEGTRLLGIATASPRDISVRMVEPFPGVVEGLHIPHFACPLGLYTEGTGLTGKGVAAAENLLVKAHQHGLTRERALTALQSLLDGHRGPLLAFVKAASEQIQHELAPMVPVDEETFLALRRALRRDLRAGMEPKVYQRRLQGLKKRKEALHQGHRLLMERVIEQLSSDVPGVETILDAVGDAGIGVPRCDWCLEVHVWRKP